MNNLRNSVKHVNYQFDSLNTDPIVGKPGVVTDKLGENKTK